MTCKYLRIEHRIHHKCMPLLISYVVSICIIVMFRGEINLDAEEIKESKVIQEDAEMVEVRCCLFGLLMLSVPIHTFS